MKWDTFREMHKGLSRYQMSRAYKKYKIDQLLSFSDNIADFESFAVSQVTREVDSGAMKKGEAIMWHVFFLTLHLKAILETHVVTPENMVGIPDRFVDARKLGSPIIGLRQKNEQEMSNTVSDSPLVSRTKWL